MGWLLVIEVVGGFLSTALQFLDAAEKNVPARHLPVFIKTFNHLHAAAMGCVDLVVAETGAPPPERMPSPKPEPPVGSMDNPKRGT